MTDHSMLLSTKKVMVNLSTVLSWATMIQEISLGVITSVAIGKIKMQIARRPPRVPES